MVIIHRLLLSILLFAVSATAQENQLSQSPATPLTGTVYYFGFDIDRITGIPESQIRQYGYRYRISNGAFISLLKSAPLAVEKYDHRDVRALVYFGEGDTYFINREGIVRHGNLFFVLAKKQFVDLLLPY